LAAILAFQARLAEAASFLLSIGVRKIDVVTQY
jgi:hypothetical protein